MTTKGFNEENFWTVKFKSDSRSHFSTTSELWSRVKGIPSKQLNSEPKLYHVELENSNQENHVHSRT